MTDNDKALVEHLRRTHWKYLCDVRGMIDEPAGKQAADRIEALIAENERLREALMPFADAADECDEYGFDDGNQAPVDAGACRHARAIVLGERK